ncbi:DUF3189 family protein [Anaeromicrobium sediminis]|uniref:Uncharacterized protein n=1 Tax=Anaeromicrobium sediminis TaxID=1478221 RepID=A0A267MNX3_9FIRM|nr:DUF3189 family protein [Anaeromicrobium sediminis]PAB61291.1 hypothetical protein CCE28_02345 [Anaeromicrobium sediminis]
MMVIYNDFGGTHSSATAAHIHVNKLPIDRIPDKEELLSLPTFDKVEKRQHGNLIYIGEDELGCKVYTVACEFKPKLVIKAVEDMYKITNGSLDGFYAFNTKHTVNLWMKIGGFLSRSLGLVSIGRPIVAHGTLKAYDDISQMVLNVKKQLPS